MPSPAVEDYLKTIYALARTGEAATTTVTYAPMLCVLFLGACMRAIQLSQGETEKHQLPQPWVLLINVIWWITGGGKIQIWGRSQ